MPTLLPARLRSRTRGMPILPSPLPAALVPGHSLPPSATRCPGFVAELANRLADAIDVLVAHPD